MQQRCLTFGPFQLNGANGTLLREGEPLPVGRRGVRLLEALLQRPGEVLTKEELLDAAWPDTTIEEANLSVQIALLRKVLGPPPGGGEWIATIPRVGYRFVPTVAAADEAEFASGNNAQLAASKGSLPGRGPVAGLRWAAALAVVALAAIVWLAWSRPAEVAPEGDASTLPTVAVLPFDEMSGNPELSYFAQGVSDDIIAMLARVPDIRVIARNSSFAYGGRPVDLRKVGEELGATHVLEGSVRKGADRIRIVAQLIDAGTGEHVWAERFDRTGADPWALQDEVTERIVATLVGASGTLSRTQYRAAWGKDSANLQEYDYYLRGSALSIKLEPEAFQQAVAIWKEGLSKYPESSLLKVSVAGAYLAAISTYWMDRPDPAGDYRRAGELAREALADPRASPLTRKFAHVVLAHANLAERKFDQALTEAEAAIELAPYDGEVVHWVGEIPIVSGQPSRTLAWIERVEPLYPKGDRRIWGLRVFKASILAAEGKADQALEALGVIRGLPLSVALFRANLLTYAGHAQEAKAEVDKVLELDPTWTQARVRKRFFYRDAATVERAIAALAAAGLPEK